MSVIGKAPGTSRGFTLAETMAALIVLGLLVALSGLSLATLPPGGDAEAISSLRATREQAIRTGMVRRAVVAADTVWFLTDGSARGGPVVVDGIVISIDPVSGMIRASR